MPIYNINNNNNRIYVTLYGRNFRGAGFGRIILILFRMISLCLSQLSPICR